ncbi:ABC transporter permease [Desulfatibacillum aliphaticivorans]|uniref:Binding-protein-dependent transport systems inner membrane component n=1 Tax=Desulfatibacillum aliphaticivorans TaxID=218208 RepID=B8FAA5_DESAL|nr:ABC transporter permease [Desulfatibacillum aliphaticivorans]ACL03201.1 binding-protein-dependent transport systems inner membrane component [Desulfatibacillum aliphaticivorans]
MDLLIDSFWSALLLLASADEELLKIVKVSLTVSGFSTLIAAVTGVPLGFWVAFGRFRGQGMVTTILHTLLALPTVVVGLFVYAFISRRGILGPLDLLYSQQAMIIGQSILIIPVVAAFTITAVKKVDKRYSQTAMTLGANRFQTAMVVAMEARYGIMAAITAAFGRVIAEVGVSMMLGGNIKGFTRTMTTAMALEYDKGEFILAVALGLVLLTIAFGLNFALNLFQSRVRA